MTDETRRGSPESALTRQQLACSIHDYERHECSILDAFEAHPITEIALWRGTDSDWLDDSFEERLSVLQSLIDAHFELVLAGERAIERQVGASVQRRDLRRLAERVGALHARLPDRRMRKRSGDSAA